MAYPLDTRRRLLGSVCFSVIVERLSDFLADSDISMRATNCDDSPGVREGASNLNWIEFFNLKVNFGWDFVRIQIFLHCASCTESPAGRKNKKRLPFKTANWIADYLKTTVIFNWFKLNSFGSNPTCVTRRLNALHWHTIGLKNLFYRPFKVLYE